MQIAGKNTDRIMKGRIQHPMYTAAALAAANPVLFAGEIVYESDTSRHKIGDGVKAWNALPYAGGGFLREISLPNEQSRMGDTFLCLTRKNRRGITRLRRTCRT